MHATAVPASPRGLALLVGWRRVTLTLTLSTLIAVALSHHWERGPLVGLVRVVPLGFMAMLAFGLFEQWPRALPRWLARWVLQVVNRRAIRHVTRGDETAALHLKGRKEVLPVSRSYLHRFRQM